jgi:hypothetical protein
LPLVGKAGQQQQQQKKPFVKVTFRVCPFLIYFSLFFLLLSSSDGIWTRKKNQKKIATTHNSFSFMTFEGVGVGHGEIQQAVVVKKSPLVFLLLVMFFSSLLVVDHLPSTPPFLPTLEAFVCC